MNLKSGLAALASAALLSGCVVTTLPAPMMPNPNMAPAFGSASITPGTVRTVAINAGGSISASVVGANCRGYIAQAPDFAVDFTTLAGILPLTFSFNSSADTTLVVRDPQGNYRCDDDSGPGLNPLVQITGPITGRYTVWVGNYSSSGSFPGGTLRINRSRRAAGQTTAASPSHSALLAQSP